MFTTSTGALITTAEISTVGIPITAAGLIITLVACATVNKNVVDKAYYDIMKQEAKARVALKKAEKLDDTERVKGLQKVIDICEELKKERKNFLVSKRTNTQESADMNNDSVVYEEYDYLTELRVNDVKNDIFVQVLDDCDDICKMNMDKIKTYEATVLKIFDLMKTSKDKNVIKQNLTKARQAGRDTNDAIKKIKGIYGPITFGFIKTEVKKFNNKYSYITMAEKKKLAAKLEQYKSKLREYGEKYKVNGSFDKQLIPCIDKLDSLDVAARNEFVGLINSWLDGIIKEVNWTIEDINYILNLLDIEKTENSIVYKALNIGKKSKEE